MNHALPSFTCPVVQMWAENAEGERKRGRTGPDTAPGGALGLALSLSPRSSKFQEWKLSATPDHFSPFPRGTENTEVLRLIEGQRHWLRSSEAYRTGNVFPLQFANSYCKWKG